MQNSRIPAYDRNNPDGMVIWFAEMSKRNLLFHPEDSARNIVRISDGTPTFTDSECVEADRILAEMFAEHGDGVIEACYPIFMRAAGQWAALDS